MGAAYIGQSRCRVASRPVWKGDRLTATWHPAVTAARSFDLEVLHEDDDVVVVLKPAGQHSQGTELGDAGSLVNGLTRRYGPDVRLMHRLDAPTSGVLVAARSKEAVSGLSRQLREHDFTRAYLAGVAGRPPEGRCELPLVRHGRRMRLATTADREPIQARTDVTVVHADEATARTLVMARLWTGRTHQVRLHLSGLGAPVLGDRVYGRAPAPRLALHAWVVGVRHPIHGGQLWVVAPPPAGFWDAVGAAPAEGVLEGVLDQLRDAPISTSTPDV